MRSDSEMFYFVEDVMELLGLSKSKSYKVIQQFNRELEAEGYFTVPGRVSRRYFDSRVNYEPGQRPGRRRAKTA